jgi:hypothetical protein
VCEDPAHGRVGPWDLLTEVRREAIKEQPSLTRWAVGDRTAREPCGMALIAGSSTRAFLSDEARRRWHHLIDEMRAFTGLHPWAHPR